MNKIQVKVLNPEGVNNSLKMMVCAARLTQRAHSIETLDDFEALYNKPVQDNTMEAMTKLPHPTIQKFGVINVVIIGASRRFLAQITRHQNEVKFMSGSLQYSNYKDNKRFVTPYELLNPDKKDEKEIFYQQCENCMDTYKYLNEKGIINDDCGYVSPQSLRNVLIISATPYQWKHMISQRICRRNSTETRYVMLKIWEELYKLSPIMFSADTTGPSCRKGKCLEGKMMCGQSCINFDTPTQMLDTDFKFCRGDYEN